MEKLFDSSRALVQATNLEFERFLSSQIDWDQRLIAIRGSRGVGKTTILLQQLKKLNLPPNEAIYISLDDLYFAEFTLRDFATRYAQQGGHYLFLDEVHRYPHRTWAQEIKNIYDLLPDLQVIISGSSIMHLLNAQADLSRRMLAYDLPGLSFREFINLQHHQSVSIVPLEALLEQPVVIAANILEKSGIKPLALFKDYLRWGYYPYFLQGIDLYATRLNETINTVLELDLPYADRYAINEHRKIGRLLNVIAGSVPFKPNISKIAERLTISRQTVLQYLYLLEEARILALLPADSQGLAALQKPEKIYLENTNLIYSINPAGAEMGAVRETFFRNQLVNRPYSGLVPPLLLAHKQADFSYLTNQEQYYFEIGGAKKGFNQLVGLKNAYIVADDLEVGDGSKIPLWLFGFLY